MDYLGRPKVIPRVLINGRGWQDGRKHNPKNAGRL